MEHSIEKYASFLFLGGERVISANTFLIGIKPGNNLLPLCPAKYHFSHQQAFKLHIQYPILGNHALTYINKS